MPKYRVYIHETEVFKIDVAAPNEKTAWDIAMDLHTSTSRSADYFEGAEVSTADLLPDDAEVENE